MHMHLQLNLPLQQVSEMQQSKGYKWQQFAVVRGLGYVANFHWMFTCRLHRMPPARSFVTESQQLCAHILGLLQVMFAGWQLLHQTAPLGLPQRVVGLHTGMPLCQRADCLPA